MSHTSECPFFSWHCTNNLKARFSYLNMTIQAWLESDLLLAVNTLCTSLHLKVSQVAQIHKVPQKTLQRWFDRMPSWQDSWANSYKLSKHKETIIVQYILDLDSQAFPLQMHKVEDMANQILNSWNAPRVGKNWTSNFVQWQSELKTRFNRRIDYQRVQCEDPDVYNRWFQLVQNTINKYRIQDEDIYNFNKTGFCMGQITSEMVITSAERQSQPRAAQQGNQE